jgi:hypothetical protein
MPIVRSTADKKLQLPWKVCLRHGSVANRPGRNNFSRTTVSRRGSRKRQVTVENAILCFGTDFQSRCGPTPRACNRAVSKQERTPATMSRRVFPLQPPRNAGILRAGVTYVASDSHVCAVKIQSKRDSRAQITFVLFRGNGSVCPNSNETSERARGKSTPNETFAICNNPGAEHKSLRPVSNPNRRNTNRYLTIRNVASCWYGDFLSRGPLYVQRVETVDIPGRKRGWPAQEWHLFHDASGAWKA